MRFRAAFSALTGDRVRDVIIADCRTGALLRVVGARAVLSAGVGEGAQRRYGGGDRGSPGPAPVGSPPGSGQAPGDGEQPQAQRLRSATRSGPDNGVRVQVSRVVGDENDGQPDRVRCRVVERQVGQANVFGAADAVFGAAATVEEIAAVSVGQSPAAGVGGKQVIRRPSWSTGRSCAPGAALRGR